MTEVIQLPTGQALADIIAHHDKLQEELKDRRALDRMLAAVSSDFMNVTGEWTGDVIEKALKRVARFAGAKRGIAFMVPRGQEECALFFEWISEEDPEGSFEPISPQAFSIFLPPMRDQKLIILSRKEDMADLDFEQRQFLLSHGFRALVGLYLNSRDGKEGGIFLFGGPGEEYLWPEELISRFLRTVEGLFISSMRQVELTMELKKREALASALLNATTDSAVLMDTEGKILAINSSFARRLKISQSHAKGKSFYDFFSPSLSQFRRNQVTSVVRGGHPVRFEDDNNGLVLSNVIYPVFDIRGVVEQVAFYSHDITPLKDAEQSIRTLTGELVLAQEGERQRIAYDLHDNVAQELATLKISCDTLVDAARKSPEEFEKTVGGFSGVLQNSINTVREMAYELQPPTTGKMRLVDAIYNYCDEFSERFGICVDFYTAGMHNVPLEKEHQHHIQRIIQEALNNVRKHARAKGVIIRLVAAHPHVILRIDDDGRGFDVAKRKEEGLREKRMGLRGMENRVRLIKGRARIESAPGEGTRLFFEIPAEQLDEMADSNDQYYPLFT
ncbi:PAS domain-containing sensor histidine kinase [Desulfoluna spongiiphila]|uniref:PAS domain S-box-containing protein n=1 Tax=Desulfoluna spongiiphila TaxID=419481 RepID=A0A1G5IQ43_9BACT|nr:histidine kinase [Desulfoluna spongiiphila]SCY77719.1 PAS domain S-box-containing protein [Desulfoluna spongiiphila]VVS92603.1 pas fold-4 [Desulfoluna spongiiphila]